MNDTTQPKEHHIDDLKLQEIIGWKPHQAQQVILDSKVRDKVICAGTRFGKSALCGYVATKHLLADNQRIWIVSLSYDMAKKVFDYVIDFAGKFDKRLLKGVSMRPTPRFEIKEWNSWVELKSIENPASLMGEELDLVIIDEAARMKPEIWERYLVARLASRKGKSFTISTPFGRNWFYKRWLEEKEKGGSFNFTSKDGVSITEEEWNRIQSKIPLQIFKQEYEAKFLDDAAGVFRGVRGITADCLKDSYAGHTYSMGVDLGKIEDFTVITVIDRVTNEVVFFDRFNKIDYPFQKKRIISIAERYNRARVTLDSTGVGIAIKDDLIYEGVFVEDYTFTQKSKNDLIEKLSIFIEQKYLKIPENEILIDELESFGYQLSDSGNILYSAPSGLHDDCVYSLALAVWGLHGKVSQKTAMQRELEKRQEKKVSYI